MIRNSWFLPFQLCKLYLDLEFSKHLAAAAAAAAAAAKSFQLCPTLCDPIDGSPPGSPTPGILQARTLEWLLCPKNPHIDSFFLLPKLLATADHFIVSVVFLPFPECQMVGIMYCVAYFRLTSLT